MWGELFWSRSAQHSFGLGRNAIFGTVAVLVTVRWPFILNKINERFYSWEEAIEFVHHWFLPYSVTSVSSQQGIF